MTNIISSAAHRFSCQWIALGCLLLLTQCADVRLKEKNSPVVHLAKSVENPSSQTAYTQAYRRIRQARNIKVHAPAQALALYLEAARIAYQSHDKTLLSLYNHAVGQVADLSLLPRNTEGILKVRHDALFPRNVEDVIPADCLKLHGWRTHVRQIGIGAPVVLRRKKPVSPGNNPLFVADGMFSYPATALIEFPSGRLPVLRFYDPNKINQVPFWNAHYTLANDLTAPLAVSLDSSTTFDRKILLEWFGVFVPMRFVKNMGFYLVSPFDADKIPVILVHGLKSDPVTWRNAINELNADPVLRKRYQFIAFYYPTGLPIRIPAAELKRKINRLYALYVKMGKREKAKQMVIIGHSLGGLLTSVQVRRIDPNITKKIFASPAASSNLTAEAKRDYDYILRGPKPSFVRRAVFIATPHRGSRRADYYIIRLIASLVEIPKNVLTLKVTGTTAALTDFGRTLLGAEKKENSLSLLQSQSATLKILADSPFYPHIKYHSIMGDRGRGDTPHSSDGVVDYASSHLDGAASEKIVPSRHSAEKHPETIQELRRILRLNLREK